MNIEIDYAYKPELLEDLPIEALVAFALQSENLPENTEVSVSFVDNDTIAKLNEQYRGKIGPTDVLSFECDGLDDEMYEEDAPVFELGDIVIAVDVAQKQSLEFGNTFGQEIF